MKLIPARLSRAVNTNLLHIKQERPAITFAIGLAAGAGGVVMACRATLKAQPYVEQFEKEIEEVSKDPDTTYGDLVHAYWRNSIDIAKLYAPAAGVLTISAVALTGSHVEQRRRNAVLSAAYATAFTAFEQYRDRVREELGEEKEAAVYNGIATRDIELENGDTVVAAPVVSGQTGQYSFLFDEYSKMWRKGDTDNRDFLMITEGYFNDLLKMRGHVFLNEVLSHLGIDIVPEGQIVGWVWQGDGDNHIDFAIYSVYNDRFLKGFEKSVVLDFNVDGPILDKLG